MISNTTGNTSNHDKYLFFTDLDGTLLDDQKDLTEENRAALQELLSKGHLLCLSTGRALGSAMHQARKLDLMRPGCYISACNGGQIYDLNAGKMLFSAYLPVSLVRTCFDMAHSFGINIQTYTETDFIAEKSHPDLDTYSSIQRLSYRVVDDVTKYLESDPPKMLVTDMVHPERAWEFRTILQEKVGDQVDLFLSQPGYLELVPPGINKGFALRRLCSLTGVLPEHTIAAGDAENDLTMIEAARIGVCMANGDPNVKSRADYVTVKDNNNSGVAEALRRFVPDLS